jgi:hypothetical protein
MSEDEMRGASPVEAPLILSCVRMPLKRYKNKNNIITSIK